ncbi:hypothetical protein GCM10011309_08610 [Litorimonas cladophorae]|uniref:YdhG-like domain-containing protein n=1 Tax=Litorimonas cladophorae TaxID=1220491 RepID=A0A918KHH1_9PROT|nr:DUF1801 domain-containing protein [Litorimonas cladophorae]GGX61056.1 hypothetical protein GCM10011309_08610 [Litorimonas cladophorae]
MPNKTVPAGLKVRDYLDQIEDPSRQADCQRIHDMMLKIVGEPAKIWGSKLSSGIVGFGEYHYKYESGREGDHLRLGFASRAQNISIYIMPGYQDFSDQLARLGTHKIGKSCLYIKRLSDIDEAVLHEMLVEGLRQMDEKYPR